MSFFEHIANAPAAIEIGHAEVISSFFQRRFSLCPWNAPEGGLRSTKDGKLESFGYGGQNKTIAYWEEDRLLIVKGPWRGERGICQKRNEVIKAAKSAGITPIWGKYTYSVKKEAREPLVASLHSLTYNGVVRPLAIEIAGKRFYFEDNMGLLNGKGVSSLSVCGASDPATNFVWSDGVYAVDSWGQYYDLQSITKWREEVNYRVKEDGSILTWAK